MELVSYIRSLRPHYQTAIISNATDGLTGSLNNSLKIADAFDVIVGSADIRIMKPDPAIYEYALQELDRAADECVFIDDFAHNIDAANKLGMATVQYTPGIDVAKELAKIGVIPISEKEVITEFT